jgi:AMP-polyphosphate phosphotransferase
MDGHVSSQALAKSNLKIRKIKVNLEESSNKKMQELNLKIRMIQQAYIQQGLKAIIVLEGVDAAGKGGLIRRLAWSMDPRALKVWPVGAPNAIEKQMHYLWRFWSKLPAPGEFAVFDRSWYGRVLVEQVENISDRKAGERAFQEINEFERWMTDDGVKVIKVFLKISKKEQARRFADRLKDPEKNWKLTFDDIRNREKWDEYQRRYNQMIKRTSKKNAEWFVVESDDKDQARTEALSYLVKALSKGVSLKPVPISNKLKKSINKL